MQAAAASALRPDGLPRRVLPQVRLLAAGGAAPAEGRPRSRAPRGGRLLPPGLRFPQPARLRERHRGRQASVRGRAAPGMAHARAGYRGRLPRGRGDFTAPGNY